MTSAVTQASPICATRPAALKVVHPVEVVVVISMNTGHEETAAFVGREGREGRDVLLKHSMGEPAIANN
jgi:hypothetical protein